MSGFIDAVSYVLRKEGGMVSDAGGLTNYGISMRFGKTIGLTADDIRSMTAARATEIYKKWFWDRIQGDDLPPAVAFMAFDQAVNQGVSAAILDLQRAVGVADDGALGKLTRTAVHAHYGEALLWEYHARRILRYCQTPTVAVNGLGWMRRAGETFARALISFHSGS